MRRCYVSKGWEEVRELVMSWAFWGKASIAQRSARAMAQVGLCVNSKEALCPEQHGRFVQN